MIITPHLHDTLDMLAIAMCEYDAGHRAVSWNRTFLRFFPEHEGLIHVGEPYADNLRRFYRIRLSEAELPEIERYIADGVARHDAQTQPFEFLHRGRRLRVASQRSDSGARIRVWRALEQPEQAAPAGHAMPLFDAISFIPDGVTVIDGQDRILAANDMFRRLYDVPPERAVAGLTLDEVIAECWQKASPVGALRATIRNGLRYDGAPLEIELPGLRWRRVIAQHTREGIGCFVHADITAVKRQQMELLEMQAALRLANAELSKLAWSDGLTGLPNRRHFMDVLGEEGLKSRPLTLLMLDVDHFKSINDRFGHVVGDACLRTIAQTVVSAVSPALVARIGGEEFGVVLGGEGTDAAGRIAVAVRAALAGVAWSGLHRDLEAVTVSIGLCSRDGPVDAAALFAGADEALYAAKRGGRDRIEMAAPPVSALGRTG